MSLHPTAKLLALLQKHTLEELLEKGELYDIARAAAMTGYSVQHLRRLCNKGKIDHLVRAGSHFFFLPEHIESLFKMIRGSGGGK